MGVVRETENNCGTVPQEDLIWLSRWLQEAPDDEGSNYVRPVSSDCRTVYQLVESMSAGGWFEYKATHPAKTLRKQNRPFGKSHPPYCPAMRWRLRLRVRYSDPQRSVAHGMSMWQALLCLRALLDHFSITSMTASETNDRTYLSLALVSE